MEEHVFAHLVRFVPLSDFRCTGELIDLRDCVLAIATSLHEQNNVHVCRSLIVHSDAVSDALLSSDPKGHKKDVVSAAFSSDSWPGSRGKAIGSGTQWPTACSPLWNTCTRSA